LTIDSSTFRVSCSDGKTALCIVRFELLDRVVAARDGRSLSRRESGRMRYRRECGHEDQLSTIDIQPSCSLALSLPRLPKLGSVLVIRSEALTRNDQ